MSQVEFDSNDVMAAGASPEVPSPTNRARTEVEFEVSDTLGEMMDDEDDDNGESRKSSLKYLAMPATAASSARAFSIAGLIITPKQSSFDPSLVSDLHFLRENWGSIF